MLRNADSDMQREAARLNMMTVSGCVSPEEAGITDAHNHLWIAPVSGATPGAPMLVDQAAIQAELSAYRRAGGGTVIDCQPPGCGRDGRKLLALSEASGTKIVACTGFHLQKYYPPEAWMFRASQERAGQFFVREIQEGLWETRDDSRLVQAGFIKIACENTLKSSPRRLIEAAAQASLATNTAILIHTERGEAAE